MAHLLLPAALGLPGLIGGIMSAVEAGKRLSGGRIRRRPLHRPMRIGGKLKKNKRKRGRGVAADIIGGIPLLGAIAGPLVRALGGKVRRRRVAKGRGLVPIHIYQPIAYGAGLLGPGMAGISRAVIKTHPLIGKTSSGRMIPIVGGLLSPTGIGSSVRRGHYRYVGGKRVHVSPTIVRGSGGKLRKRKINRRR